MTEDRAQEIALQALAWLLGQEDLLPVFLGASGASGADLRTGAADPAFQGAVLDFVMMDDTWVRQCCDAIALPYDRLSIARQMLPGGALPNWT